MLLVSAQKDVKIIIFVHYTTFEKPEKEFKVLCFSGQNTHINPFGNVKNKCGIIWLALGCCTLQNLVKICLLDQSFVIFTSKSCGNIWKMWKSKFQTVFLECPSPKCRLKYTTYEPLNKRKYAELLIIIRFADLN